MNLSDLKRNAYMLRGSDAKRGYMRWWHSFQGICPTTQEPRTFFVEYSILNPALGTSQPILGQHPYYKRHGLKPSYLCIKAGVFPEPGDSGLQLRAYYPLTSLQVAQDPFYMQFEDCVYSENRISGSIDISDEVARHRSLMTDAGSFIWDLEVHKAVACHTGYIANAFFTAVHALESFWHGEGIRTFFRGTVILNGVTYEVTPETSYGYADKHWGRSYNQPWLQFASGHLISEKTGRELKHSALAIDGCCPKFLFFPMRRRILMQLTYTGEDFEYHFGRPLTLSRCKWKVKETNKRFIWHFKAQNRTSVVRISGSCSKEQMMPLLYESPDGKVSDIPLWEGGNATGTIELYRRIGGSLELIDRLQFENGLCAYQRS